ncbi:MAG: hypothetical protein KTR18_04585 [Acidiferrobacterales bacterium]|nr:hypothetical protein [Acidiferrobacterales bacterium]
MAEKCPRMVRLGMVIALTFSVYWAVPKEVFTLESAHAAEIKKCQDADGNWHYGNFAALSCANANVDEIDATGTKTGVDKPPPSAEEIAKQEEVQAAVLKAKEDKKKQRNQDLEVIRIYGTEQTIISTRDRKLAAIDKNIEVTRQIKSGTLKDIEKLNKLKKTKKTLKLLKEREEAVKSYNRVIRHNLTAREELSEKYISILSEFREAYGRVYTQ